MENKLGIFNKANRPEARRSVLLRRLAAPAGRLALLKMPTRPPRCAGLQGRAASERQHKAAIDESRCPALSPCYEATCCNLQAGQRHNKVPTLAATLL